MLSLFAFIAPEIPCAISYLCHLSSSILRGCASFAEFRSVVWCCGVSMCQFWIFLIWSNLGRCCTDMDYINMDWCIFWSLLPYLSLKVRVCIKWSLCLTWESEGEKYGGSINNMSIPGSHGNIMLKSTSTVKSIRLCVILCSLLPFPCWFAILNCKGKIVWCHFPQCFFTYI